VKAAIGLALGGSLVATKLKFCMAVVLSLPYPSSQDFLRFVDMATTAAPPLKASA
jgi:hypothetical protein